MARMNVFVTRVLPEAGLARIREECDAEVWSEPLPPPRAVLEDRLPKCDGLVALLTDRVDADLLGRAPRLRVISNYAVGYNNIDVEAATELGIAVGNTPDVLTDATADLAFALLIAAARRLLESRDHALADGWKTWEPLGFLGQDLVGRTIGIVGMGRIGFALAKRCRRGWDMNVLYAGPSTNADAERELQARRVELPELLRESDFVSVHCGLTSETAGMFGAAQFQAMKRTAVFINTARGGLVHEGDLYEALKTGTIFAAGLDVTDPEPPSMDNPLLRLPNAMVVPHIASATVRTRNRMAEICADNLLAGLKREPLPCWVNPESAKHRPSENAG